MATQAVFLGSIGVLAETSDIQRRAYNTAMAEAGLATQWSTDEYVELLNQPGGMSRLRRVAGDADQALDEATIRRIHQRKTEIACDEIVAAQFRLRPGVAELIDRALAQDLIVGLVTTTNRQNIDAIAAANPDTLPLDRFACVLTVADVENPKPAPDVYRLALERTGVVASAAIAFEDTAASVASARAAGIYTVAVPGALTRTQDFSAASEIRSDLTDYALD